MHVYEGCGCDLDSTKFAGPLWPGIPDAGEAALSTEATELGLWGVETLAASAAEGTGLAGWPSEGRAPISIGSGNGIFLADGGAAVSAAALGLGLVALLSGGEVLVSWNRGPMNFSFGVAAIAAAAIAASFAALDFSISSNFPVSLILMGKTLLVVSADSGVCGITVTLDFLAGVDTSVAGMAADALETVVTLVS